MNRKLMSVVFAVVSVCGCQMVRASTVTYDAATDFSTTSASGIWSYGQYYENVNPTGFSAFTTATTNSPDAGMVGWTNGNGEVVKNPTASDIGSTPGWGTGLFRAGQVALNDGGNHIAVALRWTAPTAGTVNVDASTWGISNYYNAPETCDWWGFHNTTYQFGGNSTDGVHWIATGMTVAAGDTIDFIVGTGESPVGGWNLWTGLNATVTMVPEPSSLALLAAGLIGLLAYAWRKRK